MIKIILIVLIVLLVALLSLGYFMMNFVIRPKHPTLDEAEANEKSKNVWGDYDSYPKEKLDVICDDDYVLNGILLKNEASKKYVIVTHGWCYNKYGSVKYANMFYEMGYNVYIYDLRYFGENEKTFCSMGPNESMDIIEVQKMLYSKFGHDIEIGLHGESLGCASSLMALGLSQDFSFVVADCGYADVKILFLDLVKRWFHMPRLVAYVADFWLRLTENYSFFDIRPMDALKNNNVPILFIHGAEDDFIFPSHGQMNYDACNAKKQIEFFEGAKHADSFYKNPELYKKVVGEFLYSL